MKASILSKLFSTKLGSFHIRSFSNYARSLCAANTNRVVPQIPEPDLDFEYLKNPANTENIRQNIQRRKGLGCIDSVLKLLNDQENAKSPTERQSLHSKLIEEARKVPNQTHPDVITYGEDPKVEELIGKKPSWDFLPLEFHEIAKNLGLLRTENLGLLTGHRSYYFLNELAEMEQALINYTVDHLLKLGFTLHSVPDLLPPEIIEGCGMSTKGERTQVYSLEPSLHGEVCLSGTAEMALAPYFMNEIINVKELPIKMAAVSRCYRAETSTIAEERGIYRVHQFTKVEMFGICESDTEKSELLLREFVNLQKDLFSRLGLHFQVLDMPPHELGAPAYRKFDIEAWMPGRGMYGEISSASNCTDFQSRRLNLRYNDNGEVRFVHTINGTACAVPRMLISILETNQQANGDVIIPTALRPYMNGLEVLKKPESPVKFHWIKFKSLQEKR